MCPTPARSFIVTVVVRFPRTLARPVAITRDPDRTWSCTRHWPAPWQRRTTWIRPPRMLSAAIVTADVLKRMIALVAEPAAVVTTTRA
jgi:hypothetical protein